MQEVTIIVTGQKTGDIYYSRSYPDDDYDNNGKMELYETPVYRVYIESQGVQKEWHALRFMPYWNDPKKPNSHYKTKGWVDSGLISAIPRQAVTYYDPDYGTQNRHSPYSGAIQIKGNFLIHAGPETLSQFGWGAAGCVEIIGNFDHFKNDIVKFSKIEANHAHDAILSLVKARKLFVEVQYAAKPGLKSKFYKEVAK